MRVITYLFFGFSNSLTRPWHHWEWALMMMNLLNKAVLSFVLCSLSCLSMCTCACVHKHTQKLIQRVNLRAYISLTDYIWKSGCNSFESAEISQSVRKNNKSSREIYSDCISWQPWALVYWFRQLRPCYKDPTWSLGWSPQVAGLRMAGSNSSAFFVLLTFYKVFIAFLS